MSTHKKRGVALRVESEEPGSPKSKIESINDNKNRPTKSSPNSGRLEAIAAHREQIPKVYRGNYDRAMTGKSRKAAMRAFCLECVQWHREQIRRCTATHCPLYPYRAYTSSKNTSEDSVLSQDCEKGKEWRQS